MQKKECVYHGLNPVILTLTCWVCGTNPSTLVRKASGLTTLVSRDLQELSINPSEAGQGLTHGLQTKTFVYVTEISISLPNNKRQHRTLHFPKDVLPYALC